MKDLITYLTEGSKKVLSIELDNDGDLYNLMNALYTEYLNCQEKMYKKQYEAMYNKLRKAAKAIDIEVDPDYDKDLSKVRFN